jgi:hypothetical protein
MLRCFCLTSFAFLSILAAAGSASADTMRCQSVNGNVNCAGSSGVACQTVNGKKTCVSGHGDVVQSFGKGTSSSSQDTNDHMATDDDDSDDASPPHRPRKQLKPSDPDAEQ